MIFLFLYVDTYLDPRLKVSTFYQKRDRTFYASRTKKILDLLNSQLYRYPLPLLELPTRNSRLRSSWRVFINQKRHRGERYSLFPTLSLQKDFACGGVSVRVPAPFPCSKTNFVHPRKFGSITRFFREAQG